MDQPITLWLPDVEYAAVVAAAAPYGRTPEQTIALWIDPFLREAIRQADGSQWEARRRVLESNPALAATVDAARGPR